MTSGQGPNPAKVRVSDVTSKGFVATIVEPVGEDGPHMPMQVSYMAAEPGVYTLTDGRVIEVGTTLTEKKVGSSCDGSSQADEWESIALTPDLFQTTPTIIHGLQTMANLRVRPGIEADKIFFSSAAKDITKTGFKLSLDRSKTNLAGQVTELEEVAWIALEGGEGTISARDGTLVKYMVSTSAAVVKGWGDNAKASVPYAGPEAGGRRRRSIGNNNPVVVTAKASRSGGHGGWTRVLDRDDKAATVVIDEDANCFPNRKHGAEEQVSIVAFEKPFTTVIALPELNQAKCCQTGGSGLQPSGLPAGYN